MSSASGERANSYGFRRAKNSASFFTLLRLRGRAGRGQLRTQDPFCQEVRLIPFVLSLCSELRTSPSKKSLMLLKNPSTRCAAQDERILSDPC